jgi:hypothetical protein
MAITINGLPMSTNTDRISRGSDLGAEGREIQLGAQIDEEEQQQEVAYAREPRADRLAISRRCQGETGQEGAGLLRKADPFPECRETRAPGNREDQQQLLRARHRVQHNRQHIAHHHVHEGRPRQDTPDQRERHFQGRCIGAAAQRAHRHHRQNDGDVLHDEKTDRDTAMQCIQLALVREQLDDDDGAREGQRDRDIERLDDALAQGQNDEKPNTMVKASWPRPVASATVPMSRTRVRSSFKPTTNKRTATPTSASTLT